MNHEQQLLQCALRIEQHVMRLSLRERTCCRQCRPECAAADGTGDESAGTLSNPPAEVPEYYNQLAAAAFLERSEKQVYRYRVQGRLPFSLDGQGYIQYAKSDLEILFEALHGFPKGGFK